MANNLIKGVTMKIRLKSSWLALLVCLLLFSSIWSTAFSQENKIEHSLLTIKGTVKTEGHTKADYPALARISCKDAIESATKRVPGKVIECKLENEDGSLVYGVEIASSDQTIIEVQVDAGSGAILSVEEDSPENEDILKEICK